MKKAFTLTETIIAVFIIITALVAIVALGLSSLSTSFLNKEKAIATDLAREGLEVVRSIRDSNWLDPEKSWDKGLFDCSQPCFSDPETCCFRINFDENNKPILEEVYPEQSLIENCGDDCHLCLTNEGKYIPCSESQKPTPKDIYWRLITISFITQSRIREECQPGYAKSYCLDVTSQILWKSQGVEREIKLKNYLTDWR